MLIKPCGLVVGAKTDIAHRGLSEQLKERKVEKLNRALVKGLPERDYYIIEAPIGRHQTDRKKVCHKGGGKACQK